MAIIGGILAFAGGIALLVFHIMILVKQFKSGQTLWGVLSIFINILAPIWCFMNGHKGLAIKWIVAAIALGIGYSIVIAGIVSQIPEMQNLSTPQ